MSSKYQIDRPGMHQKLQMQYRYSYQDEQGSSPARISTKKLNKVNVLKCVGCREANVNVHQGMKEWDKINTKYQKKTSVRIQHKLFVAAAYIRHQL